MAVNLTNADKALKSYYLDAISQQLDNVSTFYAMIKKNTDDVWGKEVKKLVCYGANGGIGAGTEEGNLPSASGVDYKLITLGLKNLYGRIEITDKAIRASENNAGAFVSLLNGETESLIRSSAFNLSRMLFGDGTGKLATVSTVTKGFIVLDSVRNLLEGMLVDFRNPTTGEIIDGFAGKKIVLLDQLSKAVKIDGETPTASTVPEKTIVTLQGSYKNEITGLGAIFDFTSPLYGYERSNSWVMPYNVGNVTSLTENVIQKALDGVEEKGGAPADIIICSWGVRRALLNLLSANKRTVDTTELAGGFKSISYNGIPVVADRFCPEGTMYIINSKDFSFNQLCDWQWLTGDDGGILKQVPGKPVFTATLVKYAELICARPYGQGILTGITEA